MLKINIVLKAINDDKNIMGFFCNHSSCGVRHRRTEDPLIISQYQHILHIKKVFSNARIALAMFCFAKRNCSMNFTQII